MSETRDHRIFIGIMSGTSLDGVDAVAVRFGSTVEVVASTSINFPEGVRNLLHELATAKLVDMDLLVRTHFLLAQIYATTVEKLQEKLQLAPKEITAIGLHGQTVRHLPTPFEISAGLPLVQSTLQLGSGPALAAITGIDVVHDFRSADIAVGGQGAPFVPMFDAAFFRSPHVGRVTLNIGGIANLTWLPRSQLSDDVIAFDTGPGNMIIDSITRKYFDQSFDREGMIASSGSVDQRLLTELLDDPYFAQPPPKSTGRERFGDILMTLFDSSIANGKLSATDAVATATALTVASVARALQFLPASENIELIVSGGGAKNSYLMESLERSTTCVVTTSESLGIPVQEKEAIAFAYFAKAFLDDELIHLPRTTGATKRVMLGSWSKGKNRIKS